MKVELSPDVFTDECFELIAALVRYFAVGRHEWRVDVSHLPLAEGYFREHVPKRAPTWSDLARKGLVSGAWTSHTSGRGAVTVTRETLEDHVHDLGLAARLVVENREADGAFVLALAHVFDPGRLVEAVERGWLKIVQGGGSGEVPKVVRNEQEEFRRRSRVTFLLDGDRLTPGVRSKHQAVADELREVGAQGHVLRFREVENYIPNRVLAAVSVPAPRRGLDERIKCLKTLTHDQRAHFDMKKGFADRKRERVEIHSEQQELYGSLPESIQVGLRLGFGDGLTILLLREAEAGKITESDFDALGPAVCDELRAILNLLYEIL
ncbi:hypothetical protein AB0L06_09165 [Spirillospora sp. NPDC052269]